MQQLADRGGEGVTALSKCSGFKNNKAQRSFTAQPELSAAFKGWQRYISHHIEALSHSPPHFTVRLTPTLHALEEKCDLGGVCITITLPLRGMGMDEQHGAAVGMLPGHHLVLCVEVGRQLSSSPAAVSLRFTVQVFTVAGQCTPYVLLPSAVCVSECQASVAH